MDRLRVVRLLISDRFHSFYPRPTDQRQCCDEVDPILQREVMCLAFLFFYSNLHFSRLACYNIFSATFSSVILVFTYNGPSKPFLDLLSFYHDKPLQRPDTFFFFFLYVSVKNCSCERKVKTKWTVKSFFSLWQITNVRHLDLRGSDASTTKQRGDNSCP